MRVRPGSHPFLPFVRSAALVTSLAAASLLGAGCAGESGMGSMTSTGGGAATTPWNQQLATAAAQALMQQFGGLYDSAREQPAFAGERSEYGELLDKLRILKEESAGLHAQLEDGKGKAETRGRWQRIKEVSRDAREAESWQFIPTDYAENAKTVLATTDTLDAFFGTAP